MFKALTGEDYISTERKHIQTPLNFINAAKLIFSTNKLPYVSDESFAFWRRWVVIEFPNRFENDPGWKREFFREIREKGEVEKLIVICLFALRDLWRRHEFSLKMDFKDLWMREASSIYAFAKDCLVEDGNGFVETTELYNAYVEYCHENDLEVESKSKFTRVLPTYIKCRKVRRRLEGALKWVWEGIRLKDGVKEVVGLEAYNP